MKRTDYIDWDTYFMGIAMLSALRSKDPNTRHGAVIVDCANRIISTGYNGFPTGCSDDEFPWDSPAKYNFVVHAEQNCILNAKCDLTGCTMYLFSERGYLPCSMICAKEIIQSGIKEVVLAYQVIRADDAATNRMFHAAGVKIRLLSSAHILATEWLNKLMDVMC